ncbi:hypothetical protein LZK98_11690 [Sphingomonas cannabina]|uniref:hypothetical protein n=1 Tax=Sphingomonas cannabina TaxID=2899123 RepID=UPI001F1C9B6B|nr:hypothetical protein [Sphingomonas cannabina]UIJ43753.1 hypothetical protein LZK98_11690 [Sphingomonas cannabina]
MSERDNYRRIFGSHPPLTLHIKRKVECEHDFQGWREFDDGRGGERVCTKCGLGAMAYTLSLDDLP